jgi:hypothetical protein
MKETRRLLCKSRALGFHLATGMRDDCVESGAVEKGNDAATCPSTDSKTNDVPNRVHNTTWMH